MPEDFEMQKIHFCRFRKSKSKGPLWVDPNIQIKIADLGNGCYEVSNRFVIRGICDCVLIVELSPYVSNTDFAV